MNVSMNWSSITDKSKTLVLVFFVCEYRMSDLFMHLNDLTIFCISKNMQHLKSNIYTLFRWTL